MGAGLYFQCSGRQGDFFRGCLVSELLALGFSGQGLNEGRSRRRWRDATNLFLSILEPEGQLW